VFTLLKCRHRLSIILGAKMESFTCDVVDDPLTARSGSCIFEGAAEMSGFLLLMYVSSGLVCAGILLSSDRTNRTIDGPVASLHLCIQTLTLDHATKCRIRFLHRLLSSIHDNYSALDNTSLQVRSNFPCPHSLPCRRRQSSVHLPLCSTYTTNFRWNV
jgi:hypothetical protein